MSIEQLERDLNDPVYKFEIFKKLGYEIYHPQVQRFHESRARVKVSVCPRRASKSYSAAHEMIPSVLMPNTINWIVGPSYSLAEKEFRVIHQKLVVERGRIGLPKPKTCLTNPRSGQLFIRFPWGSVLEGKSGDRPDGLLGEAVNCVIYSEAAQLARQIRERYVMQTVITCKGREIVPTTPIESAEWVHELWEWGQKGIDPEYASFNWDVTANPVYPLEELERAKKMYGEDSPMFREQFLGEWVFYAGRVYPTFQQETHVIDPFDIPPSWPRCRVIDFGHRDPFVTLWMAIGPESEIYMYKEYYCREGKSIRDHAQHIRANSMNMHFRASVADPSAAQSIEDLGFEGVGCSPANNDRMAGRARVLEYLMPTEDGPVPFAWKGTPREKERALWPRFYVFNTCKETIREFMHYRWVEGKHREGDKEKTEGEDHAMDCVRYGLMTRPSPFKLTRKLKPGTFDWYMRKANSKKDMAGFIGN